MLLKFFNEVNSFIIQPPDSLFYIAEDSETRADTFIDAIDRKFHVLAERPNMGRPRPELAEGLRSFPIGQGKPGVIFR